MVSIPSSITPFKQPSSSYTSYTSVQKKTVVNAERIETSAAQLSYQSQQTKGHAFLPNGVEKYQAIGETQPTSAAANILGFIERQLRVDAAEGATAEQLASRLQAGLEGFLQGYGEAFAQIEAMGWLVDGVKEAVEQTFTDVTQGIAALADKLGIAPPQGLPEAADAAQDEILAAMDQSEEPAAVISFQPMPQTQAAQAVELQPVSKSENQNRTQRAMIASVLVQQEILMSRRSAEKTADLENRFQSKHTSNYQNTPNVEKPVIHAQAIGASEAGNRSYEFKLKTQDGDVVTIHAASAFGRSVQNDGKGGAGYAEFHRDYLSFDVSGELDEDELAAINDLLQQVNDVAETFFSGDVFAAYDQALQVGFNDEEIAGFSLNLVQIKMSQVESAYGGVAQADKSFVGAATQPVAILSEFVQKLEILQQGLSHMGVNFEIAHHLFEMIGRDAERQHPHGKEFAPLAKRLARH